MLRNCIPQQAVFLTRVLDPSVTIEGCKFIDKSKEFQINFSYSSAFKVPILDKAYLSFECSKKKQSLNGTHTFFIGEVKIIHTHKNLHKKTILNISKVSPILYLGADHYIKLDKKTLLNLKKKSFHKSYVGKKIKIKN